MKKLFVLSAIAVLAACGGSDTKPADSSTTNTTGTPSGSAMPAPSGASTTPATMDTAKPADPAKK